MGVGAGLGRRRSEDFSIAPAWAHGWAGRWGQMETHGRSVIGQRTLSCFDMNSMTFYNERMYWELWVFKKVDI